MFRLTCSLVFSLFVAVASATAATVLTYGSAESVGMDAEVLDRAVDLYRVAVNENELVGLVLLVARDGTVVVHEALGWRDLDAKLPMEKDTLFKLASNTKPMVAMAALILAEAGKLDLDSPVADYLPAFGNEQCEEMRVRQLINHTSGLRGVNIFKGKVTTRSDEFPDAPNLIIEANKFAEDGPKEAPGTTMEYSNAAYNILGAVIEVVSGENLGVYLTRHIYEPLGMTDTFNHETAADPARMSTVYVKSRSQGWRVKWAPTDEPEYPLVRGSGGGISTAWDYAVFCQTFLNGGAYGEARILSERTVKEAIAPQTLHVENAGDLDKYENHYGLGWNVYTDSPIFRHRGSDGTFAWANPATSVIGIIFTQSIGAEDLSHDFRALIDEATGPLPSRDPR